MTGPLIPFDAALPAAARRYDYWLGGKDNFAADRASGDEVQRLLPSITTAAVENRRCLLRVVRHLAVAHRVRQFIDIGSGMPTRCNVHDVAQELDPSSRIVYIDNDPMVAVHTRALCHSAPQGLAVFQPGDLRSPRQILEDTAVRDCVDFTQPVAVLLFAVLHFLGDADAPGTVVKHLMGELPSGSFLALSHATYDPLPSDLRAATIAAAEGNSEQAAFHARSREQITAFLDGLHLIQPGVVSTHRWHPELTPTPSRQVSEAEVICYAAVARSS